MKKKRNAQDATLRNINALKKRVTSLERMSSWHLGIIHDLHSEIIRFRRTLSLRQNKK